MGMAAKRPPGRLRPVLTSTNAPLRVDWVPVPGTEGRIGLTFCPGKKDPHGLSAAWDRDLAADLAALADAGLHILVTLLEDHEFPLLQVEDLPRAVRQSGIPWLHLPIPDGQAPDRRFEAAWLQAGQDLRRRLRRGERVVVHCRGGLGRTGTVAARLLIELGMAPGAAIQAVRTARPGTIETLDQEAYVLRLRPVVESVPGPGKAPKGVPSRAERLEGGLIGLLVGDALGVPYEFNPPDRLPPAHAIDFEPPPGFRRSHPGARPGSWSDDGAQALCLLASLLDKGTLDLDDFAGRLVRWLREGYMAVDGLVFDCGIQTAGAIERLRNGVLPEEAGARGEHQNGNGSLMRVLPLALWHRGPDEELVAFAHRQSLPTHGHLRSQVCCALYCLWARQLLNGAQDGFPEAVARLEEFYAGQPGYAKELDRVMVYEHRDDPRGAGYVVDTLWSVRHAMRQQGYADVVRTAILLGDDTDTTACLAGGLAGVREGIAVVPEVWVRGLRGADAVEPLLNRLLGEEP